MRAMISRTLTFAGCDELMLGRFIVIKSPVCIK